MRKGSDHRERKDPRADLRGDDRRGTRLLGRRRAVHCQVGVRASNLFRGGSNNATQEDDVEANLKKLELLYDHTKFHIGVCLILTSAYITLVTSKIGRKDVLPVLHPTLAWTALALFLVAGISAGVIASRVLQCTSSGAEHF